MNISLTRAAVSAVAIASVLVGCSTIRDAHRAQEEVADKGNGVVVPAQKVSLVGAPLVALVNFAMTNRPSIATARLAVDDARLEMKTIAADAPVLSDSPWTAPKLSVSGSHSESSIGTKLEDHEWSTEGDPSASVSLELLVYDFGRYGAKARQQAEKTVAAELSLVDAGYEVFDEVASAYFTFLTKQALFEVALTNEQQYAEHLQRAQERLDAGEAYNLDVLKARLDLANAQKNTIAASNLVDTTGASLMKALGIEAPRGTWETVIGGNSMGISEVYRGFACTDFSVNTAFELARTNSPTVQVKRAQLRAASHAVDYAIADMLPNVSVSASLSWTDPLWYFKWGAKVTQNIFQGFRKTTAVDRAVVAMKEAEAALDEAEQKLSVNLETAIANRDNSAAAIASAKTSVISAKENLDLVMQQYQVGSVSRVELSDAIASYSQALGSAIEAFYTSQCAEAKLYRLMGRYPEYHEEIVKGMK